MERIKQRARPALEGLEGRALLNASRVPGAKAAATAAQVDTSRRLAYTTNDGAKVTVTLKGVGSLAGSSVGPDGALNLVYAGTNVASKITGQVSGGSGHARLGSIRDANVPITSLTGVGAETIGIVRLPDFDLISGGTINLLGGVDELSLNSVAANTQVRLRDNPLNTTIADLAGSNSSDTSTLTGVGTLDPKTTAFGGPAINGTTGAIDFIDTVGNGQNARGTPGLSQEQVSNGRDLQYAFQPNGGLRLTGVGGTFTPGPNLIEPRDVSKPGPRVAPPGVIVLIDRIAGATSPVAPPLGDPLNYNDESFQPDLAGAALIDVQGNIQSFRARRVNGLVLNDAGNLNLLSVKTLTNSSVVGLPISHVQVKRRSNASIVSSSRLIGIRGDVTVIDSIRPIGPLSLP